MQAGAGAFPMEAPESGASLNDGAAAGGPAASPVAEPNGSEDVEIVSELEQLNRIGTKPRKRRNLVVSESDNAMMAALMDGTASISDLEMKVVTSPSQ